MAKRRARGEGGVYYDKGRKLYVASGAVGGRRVRVYSPVGRLDALERLKAKRAQVAAAGVAGTEQSTAQYLDFWLGVRRAAGMRPSTDDCYTSMVTRFLKPHLGAVALRDLTPLHVHGMFEAMAKAGASARMRALAHSVLRTALTYAVKALRVLPHNAAAGVSAPKSPKPEMLTWTAAQAKAFVAATAEDWLGAVYAVAAASGAREGELLGLHWPEVNFKAGSVRIEWNLVEVRGAIVGRTNDLKTPKSKRTIPLDATTMGVLRRQRERLMAAGLAACPWVFPNVDGGPMLKSNLLRAYHKGQAKAKVPRIRFHDLRHTHATLLMASGENPKAVSERLGHSDIEITLRTYTHVSQDQQRGVSDRYEAIVANATEEK